MPIIYDPKQNRYRSNGKFISPKTIRREIDKTVDVVRRDMRQLGKQLANEEISLADFQIAMQDLIKTSHSLTASIGKGGREQMGLSDWGRLGNSLKKQYGFLNRLARDIENGKVGSVQLENRAGAYANGLRESFYREVKASEKESGAVECRRVINSKEGCDECASYTDFMPIDEMPDIGDLTCGVFCLCDIEFK